MAADCTALQQQKVISHARHGLACHGATLQHAPPYCAYCASEIEFENASPGELEPSTWKDHYLVLFCHISVCTSVRLPAPCRRKCWIQVLKIVLERRANPEAVCDAGPPAMWAAGSGKSATLQALLQAGATPMQLPTLASAAGLGERCIKCTATSARAANNSIVGWCHEAQACAWYDLSGRCCVRILAGLKQAKSNCAMLQILPEVNVGRLYNKM